MTRHAAYWAETADAESIRIRKKYLDGITSTASAARRFIEAELAKEDGEKSWRLVKFRYDEADDASVPDRRKRVRVTDGPTALGAALADLLSL